MTGLAKKAVAVASTPEAFAPKAACGEIVANTFSVVAAVRGVAWLPKTALALPIGGNATQISVDVMPAQILQTLLL